MIFNYNIVNFSILLLSPLFLQFVMWATNTCAILYNFRTAKIVFHARAFATFYFLEKGSHSRFCSLHFYFISYHTDSCPNYIYYEVHIVFRCVSRTYKMHNCNCQSASNMSDFVQISRLMLHKFNYICGPVA